MSSVSDNSGSLLQCKVCGYGITIGYSAPQDWVCPVCKIGSNPSKVECLACGLSCGIFLSVKSDHGKWLHLLCAKLLNLPVIRFEAQTGKFIEDLFTRYQLKCAKKIHSHKCWICNGNQKSAVVRCKSCKQFVHIRCFITREKVFEVDGIICPCKFETDVKLQRKKIFKRKPGDSSLPSVRAPTSFLKLDNLFEKIIPLDYLWIFRKNPLYSEEDLKKALKISLKEYSPAFLLNYSSDYLTWEISASQKPEGFPKKKLKLSYLPSSSNQVSEYNEEHNDIVNKSEKKEKEESLLSFLDFEEAVIDSLDDIYMLRVRQHFYFSIEQVFADIQRVVMNKLKNSNAYMVKYCNHFLREVSEILEKHGKGFQIAVEKDWKQCLQDNQNAIKVESWARDPHPSRKYQEITDYLPYGSNPQYLNRLKTSKKGSCDGAHCKSLDLLGPLDLVADTWHTDNSDRKNKTECSECCLCIPEECKNRQITHSHGMKIGLDVEERETWGFDVYTYRNFMAYTRHPLNEEKMHHFISKSLPKAINQCTSNNWDIRNALKLILEKEGRMFTLRDQRYAHSLLNAIQALSSLFDIETVLNEFRIHPKGTGVICTREEGISQNQFIVEYLGELYTPSKWYEKQDIIKHLINKQKREGPNSSGEPLPDFYNIILERHSDDTEGYDLMMVDPIVKGNFGSRLSHSCSPNCGTVTMVARGRYCIGMYALSSIKWGEELTFDYNSVTESSDEQRKAVCLCGSPICRRYYLALDKAASGLGVTNEAHNFLDRVAALLKACDRFEMSQEKSAIFEEYNIKNSVLSNTPNWLIGWIYMILNLIHDELKSFTEPLIKKCTRDSRIQNLVITTDKVKYCLSCLQNTDLTSAPAPMQRLSESETLLHLWGNDSFSIKNQVKYLVTSNPEFIQKYSSSPYIVSILELLSQICTHIDHAKFYLLQVRDLLRQIDPHNWITAGIADILHMHACTKIYFKENQYPNFVSEDVEIRYCDLMKVPPKTNIYSDVFENETKKYSSTHIQGTLIGWFKQTVEKPGASLSADKRGPVTISSIYHAKDSAYTPEMRTLLLKHIQEKPSTPWPTKFGTDKVPWCNFANRSKVLGSPMFDAVYYRDISILKKCFNCIDLEFEAAGKIVGSINYKD